MMRLTKKGQSVSEYAIIIGVISSALIVLSMYFQRSIHSVVKAPIDNLGGFGSGMYAPERIQEIGVEDNVSSINGQPAIQGPYYTSTSDFSSTKRINVSDGGARGVDINENTQTPVRRSEFYQKIKYDQVTQPNERLGR